MAMMISKFHKMIQSKVVWYIILGVIVIAFVGFFTPSMRSGSTRAKQRPAGELYGKKVMPKEYNRARYHAYIWQVLSTGSIPKMTEELETMLEKEAWQRLAALRKAESEKIIVADQEVVKQIQRMAAFQNETGVFDKRAYQAALQYLKLSSSQVEEIFREQIVMFKLVTRPIQAALISPTELRQAYHLYTDRFVLETALFPREQTEKEVVVSREEAELLFAENREAFRMPSKVRVSYVEWPVSDFIDQAEIPEGAALQVYNQNLDHYRVETTGDVTAVEYKAFEDVEEEINGQILQNVARRSAAEEATALVAEVSPKAEGDLPDFAGAAAAAGLTVKTLPAFGRTGELPGIDETAPFRQAASRLQRDAYSSFSDAVVGKEFVYVLSLEQHYPSFLPDFSVVEERVMEEARKQAVVNALSARAGELQEEISTSLAAGGTFADALKPHNLPIETTEEFNLTTPLDNRYAEILVPLCLNSKEGELCQLVPVAEGILVAYVAQRKTTDAEIGLPAVRQELIAGLTQNRAAQLATVWREFLLRDANFKDLTKEK